MYLLDTNIISELRRPRPHPGVVSWLQNQETADLFISAVTIGEIQRGVELTKKQNASKAKEIEGWIDQIVSSFHILNMDAGTFREWARLMHGRQSTLSEDAMIAATALQHRLKVVSRNVRDFELLGIAAVNPFRMS